MLGENKFNSKEYLAQLGRMTGSELMAEWDRVTAQFQTKFSNTYVLVKVSKNSRNKRTSTGRRFVYAKIQE